MTTITRFLNFTSNISFLKSTGMLLFAAAMAVTGTAQNLSDFRSKTSGNWNTAGTWETFDGSDWVSAVTAPNSAAGVITIRNGHTVTVNSSVTADQIELEGDGFLTIAAALTLSDGSGNDLTVNGTLNFQSGSIIGPGNVVIGSSGILAITTTNSKILEANLTNHGVINWNDGGINFSANPVITNHGTWNLNGNYNTSTWFTTGSVVNSGIISKNSSGTSTFGGLNTFDNSGSLVLNSGILSFNTGTFNNSGTISFNGGTLNTSSSFVLNHNTGSVIGGSGIFTNGGTFKLNIDLSIPSTLNFSTTGTIDGNGNLTLNIDFTFSGTIKGNGFLLFNENAVWNGGILARPTQNVAGKTLTIATSNTKNLDAPLTNNGTLDWQNGSIAFSNTPTLTNNGTWIISGNNTTTTWFTNGNMVNTGTITKTSSGTSTFAGITTFENSGTFNFNAGTVQLNNGTYNNTGNMIFNSGILNTGSSVTLNHNTGSFISGSGSFNNGGTLKLNMDMVFASSLLFSNTGTIEGNGNLTINNDFAFSGIIRGSGLLQLNENAVWSGGNLARITQQPAGKTFTLAGTSTKNLDAHLTINGTLDWQGGTIAFSNTPTLTSNGSWIISGNNTTTTWFTSGNIVNTGIITKTSTGTTTFAGISSFQNSGTVNFEAGTVIFSTGTYNNSGNLLFNSGNLSTGTSATLHHNAGSVITGTGSFSNAGTFKLNIDQVFPSTLLFSSTGTIDGSGNLTLNNDFTFSGTIKGTGLLFLNENATWNGGELIRAVTVPAGKTFSVAMSNTKFLNTTLTNNGTLNWMDGTIAFSNTPTLTNNGHWMITGNNTTTTWLTSGNIINAGTISKTSTGTTTFNGVTSFTHEPSAYIKGVGTLAMGATTFNNNGIIKPGNSPGILIFNNQQPLSANSTLEIELLDNSGPGTGHSQLQRNANLTLNGTLKIVDSGNVPDGTYIIISLSSGTISGNFINTDMPAGFSYQVSGNTVSVIKNTATIACPNNRTVTAPSGQCNAQVNNLDPVIEEGQPYSYTLSGATTGSGNGTASGLFFNAGVSTVTYTMTNNPQNFCSFTVTVNTSVTPSVFILASSSNICPGDNVVFTAFPSNGGTPVYQWTLNGQNVGTNSNSYETDTLENGDVVSVSMASSLFCAQPATVNSNPVTVTVNPDTPPTVTISASNTTACQGQTVTFTATPGNAVSPSYQWKINGQNAGSNSSVFSENTLTNGDVVSVVLTTSAQCASPNFAISNEITITVPEPMIPSVTIEASATEICAGDPVTFTATPQNGGNPVYQWKVNGQNAGTNSPVFTPSNLQNGATVTVYLFSDLTCAVNPAISNSIAIIVKPVPVVTITGTNQFCEGSSATLTASEGESWLWNTGATTQSITVTLPGTYSVTVTNDFGCSGSASFTVLPFPAPTGSLSLVAPADSTYGVAEPVSFSWTPAVNATAYDLYIWRTNQQKPLQPTVAGLTGTTHTYTEYLNKNFIYLWQVTARNLCSQSESPVHLFSFYVFTDLTAGNVTSPATAVAGTTVPVSFTVTNTGSVGTGIIPWKDEVYLSNFPEFNAGSAILVASPNNVSALAPGQSYTQNLNITIPQFIEGEYYIFVRTDAFNIIQETDEANNMSRTINPVSVSLPPYPDLAVAEVQSLSGNIIPGESLTVGWSVQNSGNAAAVGGWSQRISVINGSQVFIIGYLPYNGILEPNGILSQSSTVTIPQLPGFEGEVYLQVRLTPNSGLIEKPNGSANNTALSAQTYLMEKRMFVTLPVQSIQENSSSVIQGTIYRSGSTANAMTISLSALPAGRVTLPVSVTLPANLSSVPFTLTSIDNILVEGNIPVDIVASVSGYPDAGASLTVIDNEVPSLTAQFNETEAYEGDTVQLVLIRSLVTSSPLTIALTTSKPNQISLPATAQILGDEASVVVNIPVVSNNVPELTETLTINASATGYIPTSASLTIHDDDLPQLSFTVSPSTISEGGGSFAAFGTVQLSAPANGNTQIMITVNQGGQLYFPAQVTIPNGAFQQQFNIGAVDNGQVDGSRTVNLTAAVYISSCNCGAPPETGGAVTQSITILDNDGPALSAVANPFAMPENIPNAGHLTITRNTPGGDEILVSIQHDGNDEIVIAPTAVIPQGQNSVMVPFGTLNDDVEDGNQIVTVTVAATGYATGSCWIMVSDRNLPDYVAKNLTLSRNSMLINEAVDISFEISNEGYALATSGAEVKFFLSSNQIIDNSDVLLSTQSTPTALSIGQSVTVSHTFVPTGAVGNFFIIAAVNQGGVKTELVTINNTSPAQALAIAPDYTATAQVDGDVFNGTTPILITGITETVAKSPAPGKAVDVYIMVNGSRRVFNTTSDQNGQFSISFTPLNGEGGDYTLGACYPGQGLTAVQDDFVILGVRTQSTGHIIWDMFLNETRSFSINLENISSLDVNNIQLQVLSSPPGCTVNATPIGSLGGNALSAFNYSITASEVTPSNNYQEVKMQLITDEGTRFRFSGWFYSRATKGNLKLSPVALNKAMVTGITNYAEFEILNNGMAETGPITVLLPELEWMSLATVSNVIPSLLPGETAKVTLKLTPGDDLQLNNPITGQLALQATNANGINVPFSFEPVSVATGSLLVDVTDEYTFNTEAAPHLAGASVTVLHPYTGVVIAQGTTNSSGHFLIENITEGYYNLRVTADRHSGFSDIIFVEKGILNTEEVFLSFQAITYSWNVVPTMIEDEYEINLIATFETHVPAPVVVMNMPDSVPQLGFGQTFPFILTATNLGLITANDIVLKFPEDEEYEFIANVNVADILPQSTLQIPVVMKRKETAQSRSALKCKDVAIISYKFQCGPEDRVGIAVDEVKFKGRFCSNAVYPVIPAFCFDCLNPGYPPTQGFAGFSFPFKMPTTPFRKNKNACDPCLAEALNAAWDCSPVPNFFFTETPAKFGFTITGNTLSSGYGLYKEFMEGLDKVKCVYNLAHSLGCKINAEFFKEPASGQRTGVPEEIIIAQQDLFMVDRSLKSVLNIITESYHDSVLTSRQDFPVFHDSVSYYAEEFIPIDEIKQNQLLEAFVESDIAPLEMTGYFTRWNSTVEAWNQGIYTPTSEYPNIIDSLKLYEYALHFDTAMNYTIERGFQSVGEMYNFAFDIFDGYTDQLSNAVCATVTVQFSQTLTMTREAFEGTLTVFNGHETDAMENISLDLEIRDENGTLSNDLFQINVLTLNQMTGIDGTGTLDAQVEGSVVIQFIPERGAAPEFPKSYSFGGTLSYLDPFTGEIFEQTLFPVTLQVNPSPDLYIDYFMQRDILGDDALTTPIEPSIPAELAVMIDNRGAGTAYSVTVESAQPVIIENEKGLLIDFAIVGANLGGKPKKLGLMDVDFGNIEGGKTAVGQWWFTSSLLGHFISYEVSVNHMNSFGNPDLSLVSEANIHELIKSVRVYGPLDDSINDFLVNDNPDRHDIPDALFYSNGTEAPVYKADTSQLSGVVTLATLSVDLTVTPFLSGWNYTKLNDPGNGFYRIVSCVRDDGQEIPLENIWLTWVTIPDGGEPIYENKLHFLDIFEDINPRTYTITFEPVDLNVPEVVSFTGVPETPLNVPLTNVQVTFNKPIDASTFDHQDITLKNQGGPNLSDSTVVVTQISDQVFDINFGNKTQANGFYVLTVQAAGIADLIGNYGVAGKQASWIQSISVPAIDYFFGVPQNGQPTDTVLVLFNMPVNESTFTLSQIELTDGNGNVIPSESLQISSLSFNNVLFKISGLLPLTSGNGNYQLTFKLTEIQGETGQFGILDQSVNWLVCQVPAPTAFAGADDLLCTGGSYQLTGTVQNAGSFFWTTSGTGSFDNAQLLNAVYTPGQQDIITGKVTLTLTAYPLDPCAGSASSSFQLTIKNAVEADAGSNAAICQNKTHSLFGTVTQASGYYWITSGDGTFSNPNILTPSYTPGTQDIAQGSAILSLVAQPSAPCTLNDTASMVLTIQKSPTVSAGTLQTVCENQVVQLQGTATHYSSLVWLNNLGDGIISNRTILNPVYTLGVNDINRGFVILTLYAQPISPCFAPVSSNVRINVTKQPVAVAGNNSQICENLFHPLAGIVQNAGSFAWTTSGDGIFSSTTVTNPVYTPGAGDIASGSVVLTLTAQPRTPCQSPAVSSLTLSIQKSPVANAGNDDLMCEGDGYQLTGFAQHYTFVQWQTQGDGSFSDPGVLNPVYYPGMMDALNGTAVLSLTAYPPVPCTNPAIDYVEIDLQTLPVVEAGNDIEICHTEGIALNGSVIGSNQYSWSSSGDGVFENPYSLNAAYIPGSADILSGSVVLTLSASSVLPCTQIVSDQLTLTILTCQELNLSAGWTGISAFVDPVNPYLNEMFAPVMDDLIILYSQSGIFWPGQNINTIGNWDFNDGYIVKMAESLSVTVPGNRAENRTLALNAGWNLIPVHSECDAVVVELFAGTNPVMVKEVAGWNLWWPALNINTLGSLQPGKSYYILMAEPGSITFPACDQGNLNPGSGSGHLKMSEMIQASPWNRFEKTPSTHMLGIPVSAFEPGMIQNGDYIGAFDAEGNCFGLIAWDGENAVLVAFGDDPTTSEKDGFEEGEAIFFRLYVTSAKNQYDLEVSFDHTLPHCSGHFSVNGVSAIQAFTLDATRVVSPENMPVMIYPNPADNELFIDFAKIVETRVVIHEANGKEVLSAVFSDLHNRLDISGLRKGIYFLKLENRELSITEKIVVR